MELCRECGSETDGAYVCPSCGAAMDGGTESFAAVIGSEAETVIEEPAVRGPVLVVQKGPEVGERFTLDRDGLSLGRDPDSDIFLNDVTVSRNHASLSLSEGAVRISDSGSLNGTYVNGERVDEADLEHGDTIQVGRFQMILVAGGAS